jgi:hypothetical protein
MILLLVLLLVPFTAHAATYWVTQGASGQHCTNSASDPGAGNSSQTVSQGVGCLGSGDTLIVHGGTYTESIGGSFTHVPSGGDWGSPTTVMAAPGESVWMRSVQIENPYVVIDGINLNGQGVENDGSPSAVAINASHVRLQNMEMTNMRDQGVTVTCPRDDVQLINLDIHHMGWRPGDLFVYCEVGPEGPMPGYCHATYIEPNCTNLVIRGGRFHHNAGYGVHNSNPGQIVDGVTIHDNYAHGYLNRYGASNNVIRNSVFYNNGGADVFIAGNGEQLYNNTFDGNPNGAIILNSGSTNFTTRNNIFYNIGSGISTETPNTSSNNLCYQSSGTNLCQVNNQDPLFANRPLHDYRLTQNSPAINAGFDLNFLFTTDIEGNTRVVPFDIGAYEFAGVTIPPEPVGLVGEWKLDAGTGTNAVNTASATLGTLNGTLNSVGWTTPGIVGDADLATNGARWVEITPTGTSHAMTTEFGISAWWKGTGAGGGENGCEIFDDANGLIMRIEPAPDARLSCGFYHGAGWRFISGGSGNLLNNNAHHLSCSLQSGADGLRARIDNGSVAQVATSQTVSFALGGQAYIGRHPTDPSFHCGAGTIGNVYVFDQYISDSGNTNLFLEYIPLGGVSGIHVQWRADDPPATIQGSLDTPITWTIGNTLVQEWYISNNSGASVVAHYPQFCSRNGGPFVQVSNTSQSTIGVQVATSANANMGDSVTPAQNFGLTPVDGRAVVDTVAESLTTLPHGGVTAWRYYMAFGGPAAASDTYRCKPRKPFTLPLDLDHYFDDVATSIPLITLQVLTPPQAGVKSGGTQQGGKRQ